MRLCKPKLLFLYCPLSSVNYCENYSQANHEHLMGVCLDDKSPPHASTETKRKNQECSFPHKAQDKINPTYIFKVKMSAFLAFVSFAITCLYITGTQAHYL